MSDRLKVTRRRVFLGTVVLLVVLAVPWAWRNRPMSARERTLLGTWRLTSAPQGPFDEFTFTRDRCFSARTTKAAWTATGTWRGSADEILLFTPHAPLGLSWSTVEIYARRILNGELEGEYAGSFPLPDASSRVLFTAQDGSVIVWERVP